MIDYYINIVENGRSFMARWYRPMIPVHKAEAASLQGYKGNLKHKTVLHSETLLNKEKW